MNYIAALLKDVGIFGAHKGSDFPSIIHLSLPIDDFISERHKTKQALDDIRLALQPFTNHSNDSIVLACNTAHLLQKEIEKGTNKQLVSLLDSTHQRVKTLGIDHVGLLASPTTIHSRLYHDVLEHDGIAVNAPVKGDLVQLEIVLRNVIAMKTTLEDIRFVEGLIEKLVKGGAQAVILGCTELSTLELASPHRVIDPLNEVIPVLLDERQE